MRRRLEVALVVTLLLGGLTLRLALCRNYVFAGSDSYGYIKLADEWRAHGRYALGPAPEPLYYARPPLYPLFIRAVKGEAKAEMMGGPGWGRITLAQAVLDVFLNCLLLFFIARRLSGPRAGLIALGLVSFIPYAVIPCGAALTECLAIALATATVALLVLDSHRGRAFLAAGAAVALSTLVRPDGILLAFGFVPLLFQAQGWRTRARLAALAALGFALVFAPWPARNLARFGNAWALGSRVDRKQQPIAHWEGAQRFLRSYGRNWQTFNATSGCVFERACALSVDQLVTDGAVDPDRPEERAELARVIELRNREGLSEAVSQGFDRVAQATERRHPLRVFLWLPLLRAVDLWTEPADEIFQKPPLPRLYPFVRPLLPALTLALFAALLLLVPVLLWRRGGVAWVLAAAIAGRTAILAFNFYCAPRYIREVTPLAYAAVAAGAVELGRWLVARRRARIEAMTPEAHT